jgi:hypothetical protein
MKTAYKSNVENENGQLNNYENKGIHNHLTSNMKTRTPPPCGGLNQRIYLTHHHTVNGQRLLTAH